MRAQDQLGRAMKVPVEVVPKQTAADEIAGRPVADEFVIPVVPNFVSEHLRIQKRYQFTNGYYALL